MVVLEAAAVLALIGVLVYGTIMLFTRRPPVTSVGAGSRWRVNHYESGETTRVVVQRVSANAVNVLDEHVVASLPIDDPDYDTRFLEAMSAARERRALFEAEDEH